MPSDDLWRGLLVLVGLVGLGRWLWRRGCAVPLHGPRRSWRRQLRPRTPRDCPGCRAALATPAPPAAPPSVLPWRAPDCRGGRPPTVAMAGFACPHGGLRAPLAEPVDRGGRRRPRRSQRRTPAVALGVTDHPWMVLELLAYPLPPPRAQCA